MRGLVAWTLIMVTVPLLLAVTLPSIFQTVFNVSATDNFYFQSFAILMFAISATYAYKGLTD